MKLKHNSINYSVTTVDALLTLVGEENDVVVVTDENRGGTFVYKSADSATNNGGTIFNGWTRQYDGAVNVKWFGAKGDGITDDTLAIQACYNAVANLGGGNILWNKANYNLTDTILFSGNTRTDLGKSTVNSTASIVFNSGVLNAGVVISTTGTSFVCDEATIENGEIDAPNSISFRLTNFRFNSSIKNIVSRNVAQIIVADTCFYSDYEDLIYFGDTDFVAGTASSIISTDNIIVTNAIKDTLIVGMELAGHFFPIGTTILMVGASDSAGAGFANIQISNNATRTSSAGGANSGFIASLNPKALYEFNTANSDMSFTKCSGGSRFRAFELNEVNSTTFTSCDVEASGYGFKMVNSGNNSFISTHTETIYGYIWDYSENIGGGSVFISGYNGFNIAGVISTGATGKISGSFIMPKSSSAFSPYGFTNSGESWVDLSSPNSEIVVMGSNINTHLNGYFPTLSNRGLVLSNTPQLDTRTLDFYEEGVNTTLEVLGGSVNGTATYSVQTCTYQRVGNTVHINAELSWTGHTGNGYILLSNFPFTPKTNEKQGLSIGIHSGLVYTAGNHLSFYMPGGSINQYELWETSPTSQTRVFLPASGNMQIFGTYTVQ